MKLTETPDTKNFPKTHYVFMEKIGPFQETAQQAWQECHKYKDSIAKQVQITGAFALYKIRPQMIYRAGFAVSGKPESLPPGFQYEEFKGGKYARFTLTGSYSQLPEACGKVFSIVEKTNLPMRDDFFGENYVNDPNTTPEDQLITEILIPTT